MMSLEKVIRVLYLPGPPTDEATSWARRRVGGLRSCAPSTGLFRL